MVKNTNQNFKIVINSEHKLFDLHIKETIQYRDLIFLFVKREFVSKYKQTVLGPLWAVIQPLLTTVVFTIVFGSLAGLTTADIKGDFIVPSFLFYMCGNICWTFFSGILTATSNTFISNSATMGKVYYPRLVSPISTALSNLISFGIQFAMLIVFWLYFLIKGGTSLTVSMMLLLVPVVILEMMILATGCGIIISALTTKYRDLAMLVGFGLELWRYACPVAYGLGMIPEKYMALYMLNPVTPMLTTFRYGIMGFGYFHLGYFIYSWIFSIALFFIGLILFSRIERTFMDTI